MCHERFEIPQVMPFRGAYLTIYPCSLSRSSRAIYCAERQNRTTAKNTYFWRQCLLPITSPSRPPKKTRLYHCSGLRPLSVHQNKPLELQ
jgi:hypothetical protein